MAAVSGEAGRPLIYGEFLSTLVQLAAAANGDRWHSDRLRINRGHVVLRHAKIYARRLSTDPAGAVSARHPCHSTRDGLSLLPQLCRSGGAFQFTEHPDLHELPFAGAKGQSKARTSAGKLEDWETD